jgi:maltose O-acetyltransferase
MGFEIGTHSAIFMDAWFDCKRGFRMGRHSVINQGCRIDPRGGVEIGDNVSISAEVCILTADHDPQSPDFSGRSAPVHIEDHVFIGTRAMILRGVTIGRGAVVAAAAVVTRDVEPFSIVTGCPARKTGARQADLHYTINYNRLFF